MNVTLPALLLHTLSTSTSIVYTPSQATKYLSNMPIVLCSMFVSFTAMGSALYLYYKRPSNERGLLSWEYGWSEFRNVFVSLHRSHLGQRRVTVSHFVRFAKLYICLRHLGGCVFVSTLPRRKGENISRPTTVGCIRRVYHGKN